jgi:type IV secretory pathway VirB10-like protein
MRLQAVVVVGFTLLLAALPATAQWKWKDARGQVVISDVPPPREIPDRDVLQKPDVVTRRAAQPAPAASAPAQESVAKAKADPELEARKKKSEQEQSDKVKAEEDKVAAQRAENCRRARSHMATLDSGIRLSRTNEKGEREILDDKQVADEVNRTRQIISSDCRAS